MNLFIQDITNKIIVSLATLATIRIVLLIVKSIQNRIIESQSIFSISGYWVASYRDLRTPNSSANHLEIVRLKQKGESLFYQYEHHNSDNNPSVTRGEGQGFVRANEIFLYYKRQNKMRASGGVIILTIKKTPARLPRLDGVFIEPNYSNSSDTTISVPYTLEHIELPFIKRIKMLFRKQVFKNYQEVINVIDVIVHSPI